MQVGLCIVFIPFTICFPFLWFGSAFAFHHLPFKRVTIYLVIFKMGSSNKLDMGNGIRLVLKYYFLEVERVAKETNQDTELCFEALF